MTSATSSMASGYARSEVSIAASAETSGGDYTRHSTLSESRNERINAWVQQTVEDLRRKIPGADGSRLPDTGPAGRRIPAAPASTASTAFYSARAGQGPASVAGSEDSSSSSSSFVSAVSRQSQGGRANTPQIPYVPSASIGSTQNVAAATARFTYGAPQPTARSAQLENDRASPSGTRFKLYDPNRSWASFGKQAVQALSTPQGRQDILHEISQKAWSAAPSWISQIANAPARQLGQEQRPDRNDRDRTIANLVR